MRAVNFVVVLAVLAYSVPTLGQTADFKCPPPGTVVDFADGARVTWLTQEGNACKRQAKDSSGQEFSQMWYAPTFAARSDRSSSFIDQLKPWTLWPLSVGKKLNGRFDGTGSNPSYGTGSWVETTIVEKYEKISTKAGTFDVFVVSRKEEALGRPYNSTLRDWYAPELGVTIKSTFTDNQGANRTFEAVSVKR